LQAQAPGQLRLKQQQLLPQRQQQLPLQLLSLGHSAGDVVLPLKLLSKHPRQRLHS
jgi:hypothetical protein